MEVYKMDFVCKTVLLFLTPKHEASNDAGHTVIATQEQ
jgi:hypothetical protein